MGQIHGTSLKVRWPLDRHQEHSTEEITEGVQDVSRESKTCQLDSSRIDCLDQNVVRHDGGVHRAQPVQIRENVEDLGQHLDHLVENKTRDVFRAPHAEDSMPIISSPSWNGFFGHSRTLITINSDDMLLRTLSGLRALEF